MDEKTARDMDRLFAEGELSGPEADAILERVLAHLDREKKRPARVTRLWVGGALAAAAAAVLIVVNAPGPGPQIEEGEQAPLIELQCKGGTLQACPLSARLVFAVSGLRGKGFVSAYAQAIGSDEVVLYFSKELGGGELIDEGAALRSADSVVRLGTQGVGRYRVHAFVADRALGRAEMQAGGAQALAKTSVEVVFVE